LIVDKGYISEQLGKASDAVMAQICSALAALQVGSGPEGDVGTAHWTRGMLCALLSAEALRTAMRHFGNQPLTGAQVQWGLDHLSLTA
jgi:branched-chain amino acid transport system substrate-binding protein